MVLADYDRVRFDLPVSPRRRVKNLAQLSASVAICITLADRLRFFRAYADGNVGLEREWKGCGATESLPDSGAPPCHPRIACADGAGVVGPSRRGASPRSEG